MAPCLRRWYRFRPKLQAKEVDFCGSIRETWDTAQNLTGSPRTDEAGWLCVQDDLGVPGPKCTILGRSNAHRESHLRSQESQVR